MTETTPSTGIYYRVAVTLLALLGLTIILAFIDLGPFNIVVALTIAIAKAVLVVLFFMHLRSSRHVIRIVALAGVVWLGIMFVLTLTDFLSRS